MNDKIIRVKCTKQKNAAEFEPLSLGLDTEGESAVLKPATPVRWEEQERIIAWMDELGLPLNIGARPAQEALTRAGHELARRAVEDANRERKTRAPIPKPTGPK
ncbi:hypothetical protein K7640_02545 [Micromonospora sp. PLK6-60]|uniref:hypothetical protein n=1 Tax=Micromonospora sp. PLK6-60 TaxID=2873383 RepID=UPI001CA65B0B|nr:hypothetical protein [Micromonospora sp. PLK6-60]MBY8870720.1 hypothetical protein [Micromonospora sp. PLK6-60]